MDWQKWANCDHCRRSRNIIGIPSNTILEQAIVDQTTLRPTTLDDSELVSDLLTASYPMLMRAAYPDAMLQAALPAMSQANPVLLSSGSFYVVQMGKGMALGCGGWSLERPGGSEVIPGLAHIRHFAVHPDWTGNGIGRSIYECCEENARLAGAKEFECYSSLNAEVFYAGLGFTKIEMFDVPMGPELNFSSVRMVRSI